MGAVAEPVGDGREQPVVRVHDLLARVDDQEIAGAVGVFRFAGVESGLTEGRGLLVAEDARDGHLAQEVRELDGAENPRGASDLGQHRRGNSELAEKLVVPFAASRGP